MLSTTFSSVNPCEQCIIISFSVDMELICGVKCRGQWCPLCGEEQDCGVGPFGLHMLLAVTCSSVLGEDWYFYGFVFFF
jgi:hypothetical protein